jgi:hypothetical protein
MHDGREPDLGNALASGCSPRGVMAPLLCVATTRAVVETWVSLLS